jgi:hypothetical protein
LMAVRVGMISMVVACAEAGGIAISSMLSKRVEVSTMLTAFFSSISFFLLSLQQVLQLGIH